MKGGCLVSLTCPGCASDIQMDVELLHAEQHPDWPALNRLVYVCPECSAPQRHDLTGAQWEVLNRLTGDLLHRIFMPRGILSRFTAGAPPLTDDDLIDFGRELHADGSAT